jgi:hypothetical protein
LSVCSIRLAPSWPRQQLVDRRIMELEIFGEPLLDVIDIVGRYCRGDPQ